MFPRCGSLLWVLCGSLVWFPVAVLHGRLRELRGAKGWSGGGSAKFPGERLGAPPRGTTPGDREGPTTVNHNGETQREMRNVMFMKLRVEKVSECILERPTECFQCVFILKGKSSIFQNNLNYMGNLQGYFSKLLRNMRFLCIYSVHSWFQNT